MAAQDSYLHFNHSLTVMFFIVYFLLALASSSSVEECSSHGFDKSQVKCSDCEAMVRFLSSEGSSLTERCRSCCNQDEGLTLYSSATLLVPPASYQMVETRKFIEKHASRFEGILTIQVKNTPTASLKLKTLSGATEQLRVEEWKSDQLVDFLTSRVKATK